ncbi:MAG TPA: hypothetical protein VKT83_00555 [bacterium]|nr:hypothetical protein [bacterium]
MEIVLAPESASRIRAVLGDSVDLSPAAVPQVLARLAEAAPDLYSEVLDQLSGSDIRLDSERVLHRRHRRTVLRRALFGWGEYESDAGDRLLAKRRVAATVPLGLAAVLLVAAGASSLLTRSHRTSISPAPVGALHRAGSSTHEATPAVAPGTVRGTLLWMRGRTALPAVPPAPAMRSLSQLPPVPVLPLPSVLSGTGAVERALSPSIVFNRMPESSGIPSPNVDAAPRSPVVYARNAGGDTGAAPTLRASTTEEVRGMRAGARKVGDQLAARLATGVVVAAGVPPVPVIAEGVDGSSWLGHAEAEPDGRVHISFQTADRDAGGGSGGSRTAGGPVSGVALDPDSLSDGLSGRVVIRRRAAAASAIRAVVLAVSDYLQALARAAQVTVADGATQVSVGGAAPGWTYAASRLADTLNPQTSGAVVETLEIPAGTRCIILVTEAH